MCFSAKGSCSSLDKPDVFIWCTDLCISKDMIWYNTIQYNCVFQQKGHVLVWTNQMYLFDALTYMPVKIWWYDTKQYNTIMFFSKRVMFLFGQMYFVLCLFDALTCVSVKIWYNTKPYNPIVFSSKRATSPQLRSHPPLTNTCSTFYRRRRRNSSNSWKSLTEKTSQMLSNRWRKRR